MRDSEDEKKDKSPEMGSVVDGIAEMLRGNARRWAADAAEKRGVRIVAAEMTDAELARWRPIAEADAVGEERRKATDDAAKRQVSLSGALRGILPDEFEWVDPREPSLLFDRVAGARETIAAAQRAAAALARGEVKRVLLAGAAGSGKTTLAALIPQIMAAVWAKDRHERDIAGIDSRPIDLVVEERVVARRKAERDLAAPVDATAIPRRRSNTPEPLGVMSDAGKVLAKVMVGGAVSAHWTTAYELFRLAKKPQGFKETDPLEDAREARVLVLDDIGGEPTQANIAPVEDVIRARHDAQRITIATTGMFDGDADPNDLDKVLAPLSARYGAAVVRRIAEKGRAIVIVVGAQGARKAA